MEICKDSEGDEWVLVLGAFDDRELQRSLCRFRSADAEAHGVCTPSREWGKIGYPSPYIENKIRSHGRGWLVGLLDTCAERTPRGLI